jgi:hypothetical protein
VHFIAELVEVRAPIATISVHILTEQTAATRIALCLTFKHLKPE